jgi:hypothetical protein
VKRILLAIVSILLAFSLSSCKSTVDKQAINQVDSSHKLISAKLLKYVDADAGIAGPGATEDQKKKARDDWHKMVESDQRNIDALKKAAE